MRHHRILLQERRADNGATFGPVLNLATNGTIGETAEEGTEEEE